MPQKKIYLLIVTVVCMFLVIAPPAGHTEEPWLLSYYGSLEKEPGKPLTAIVDMTFSIYTIEQGGDAVWTETQPSVQVKNGFYKVMLGSQNPLELPCDEKYFIGIRVGEKSAPEKRDRFVDIGGCSEPSTQAQENRDTGTSTGTIAVLEPDNADQNVKGKESSGKAYQTEVSESDGDTQDIEQLETAFSEAFAGIEDVEITRHIDSMAVSFQAEIFFAIKSTTLKTEAYEKISDIAVLLYKNPRTDVEIAVHTDSIGTYDFNEQHAVQRGQAIKKALVGQAVNPVRITIQGVGEDNPIADNGLEFGRRLNRRIVITITPR